MRLTGLRKFTFDVITFVPRSYYGETNPNRELSMAHGPVGDNEPLYVLISGKLHIVQNIHTLHKTWQLNYNVEI